MEYISSDTNVWVDFFSIDRLSLPFLLPFTYIMYEETVDDELIKPKDLGNRLIEYGLQSIDISLDEFILAEEYNEKYKQPSKHDCMAMAIAKHRGIILMTGDKNLRKAAAREGVKVIGTLGILDMLFDRGCIDATEYRLCLEKFDSKNGGVIRLPQNAISERLGKIK